MRRLRSWLILALGAVLALVLVACGPDEAASPSPSPSVAINSGISGIVLLSPTCPVQGADASPCVTPYVATLVINDSDGNTVARVQSKPDGTFKVTLPPGDYVIQPMPADGGIPNATPQDVTVTADQYEQVEIDYDTGIR